MQDVFSDLPIYREMEPRLEKAIIFLQENSINFEVVETLARKYYSKSEIKLLGSQLWQKVQWIFATCSVFIVSFEDRAKAIVWESTDTLTAKYPAFTSCDAGELRLLLDFRNTVRVSMLILEPNRKKEQYLFIAGRLSDIQVKFITGSGESATVARRVAIFRQETGVIKEDRSGRGNHSASLATPSALAKKRNRSATASKGRTPKLCTSEPRSCTKRGQKLFATPRKASVSDSRPGSKPTQKRKVKESVEVVPAGAVTPYRPTKMHNSSITATKKPVGTPRAKRLKVAVEGSAAALTEDSVPVCPITPVDHSLPPGAVFFPSEGPLTPAKMRHSLTESALFMSPSNDWAKYLSFGASQEDLPASPRDPWAEIPVKLPQPLKTGTSSVALAGKDLDLYLTDAGMGEVLLDECFDDVFPL